MDTSQDATAAPLAAVFAAPAMPGASVTTAFVRLQSWTWLAQGTFVEVGPSIRTFSYAIFLAATGMALIIAGTFLLYEAYDPPIPDFRDREAALPDPRAWNIPSVDDETLHPLRTLARLVARLVSAQVRANHLKDRAWAAFVDRDEPAWRQRRDGARDELETLRRLVPATVHAADEAHEKWEQLLGEVRSLPTPESLRETARRFADELGLIDKERALIDKLLETLDERELRRALERTRADGLRTIGELVRRIHEATASEFAECEYLR